VLPGELRPVAAALLGAGKPLPTFALSSAHEELEMHASMVEIAEVAVLVAPGWPPQAHQAASEGLGLAF
tara:strand:+ start:981 stop:1187 length:207 start_codon:yes stop_codon:yes gene_type:complete